jgi:hypothetical protein
MACEVQYISLLSLLIHSVKYDKLFLSVGKKTFLFRLEIGDKISLSIGILPSFPPPTYTSAQRAKFENSLICSYSVSTLVLLFMNRPTLVITCTRKVPASSCELHN